MQPQLSKNTSNTFSLNISTLLKGYLENYKRSQNVKNTLQTVRWHVQVNDDGDDVTTTTTQKTTSTPAPPWISLVPSYFSAFK